MLLGSHKCSWVAILLKDFSGMATQMTTQMTWVEWLPKSIYQGSTQSNSQTATQMIWVEWLPKSIYGYPRAFIKYVPNQSPKNPIDKAGVKNTEEKIKKEEPEKHVKPKVLYSPISREWVRGSNEAADD